ncbi:hypothetical protein TBLA_0E00310 [Henningerozyma blattae CBS 6284]|uniref:THUMP domain-containing protein n=1 Tax=Henningerozyma blattae (strain ATCC 34711 / CBS 6284 / DSM 70876 / NBRC 10599 / NRRL Y-10934 / UCD 77-7) TaxID=1071380 RepID=I2H3Z0_HENB6|nr:hypothetical protein TBLA_0E00310 [Tetrapisispora blattae CBS 6284]CCH61092.1 hypothetical protein TBLA_0E00310 [Tetrapisispora blattae CBS 6284]
MGEKRANPKNDGGKNKRMKYRLATGMIDPGTSGIYATCARKKERFAVQELGLLFEEKLQEYYEKELTDLAKEGKIASDLDEEEPAELSIEEQIKQELSEIKRSNSKTKTFDNNGRQKKEILQFIDLNCECVVFCKTRRPIIPEKFVKRIIEELADPSNMEKRTRYIQKLTPITNSCNASMDQFIKLLEIVLEPHFHSKDVHQDYKFAVEVTRRNFNTMEKIDMINQVVSQVSKSENHNHTVDLKNYDKLILVECFKSNIGVSVVDGDYLKKYKKYNIQQIFEAKFKKNAEENEKENMRSATKE